MDDTNEKSSIQSLIPDIDSMPHESDSKTLEPIIYPAIEPGIIGKDMIENVYYEEKYSGEKAKLHKEEPINYERITEIRFEFKKLIRIDHLWILPNLTKLSLCWNKLERIENIEMLVNLKHLDLSFNYITKIENLEKLVKLEQLTLFNNLIKVIENLDDLSNLIILSLGNNSIESTDGIERFRFLKKLKALNLEGNPMAKNLDFSLREYCIAILPQITYYEFRMISHTDREYALNKFIYNIRQVEAREETELSQREEHTKQTKDFERLSKCFVENLNEHQLFKSFWVGDEDGRILLLAGPNIPELVENYEKCIFDLTQKIYKHGLESYHHWEAEIQEFDTCMEEGKTEIQTMGQQLIEHLSEQKNSVFEEAIVLLKALHEAEGMTDPNTLTKYELLSSQFDEDLNTLWQKLMSNELHLNESVVETITIFIRAMREMMVKFVEECQIYFAQMRETITDFTEDMSTEVSIYIKEHAALQNISELPEELRNCVEDHDAIPNLLVGMKENHTQRVDEREDRMILRTKEFVEEMQTRLLEEERLRNRAKILEINKFVDLMHESYINLEDELEDDKQDLS